MINDDDDVIGMYEGDPYGDEIEGGDEDKNDGLNALVRQLSLLTAIEFTICHRFQQRYRLGCAQLDHT